MNHAKLLRYLMRGEAVQAQGQPLPYAVRYYLAYGEKYHPDATTLQWNWATFFFGPVWFVYRRMYLYALWAFLADKILISIGFVLSGVTGALVFQLAGSVALSLLANRLYFYFIGRQLQEITPPRSAVNIHAAGALFTLQLLLTAWQLLEGQGL